MTSVALRPMRWWDIDRLLPLERELFGDEAWTPGMFWSELAQRETRRYLVAEDGSGSTGSTGALVAYGGVCLYPAESYIQTLAVAPGAQRAGLGSRLLTALLEAVVAHGESTVLLEVRADNERAQSMYRRFGFLPIGLRRGYYQPSGVDAVVMQLHDVEGHLAALREAAAR